MDFKSLRSDKLKLTQEEFANLYGISIQEVQELDKTGKPDMDLIVKIATRLRFKKQILMQTLMLVMRLHLHLLKSELSEDWELF